MPGVKVDAHLVDERPFVMVDLPADRADEVENIVGVRKFPASTVIAEAHFVHELKIVKQRERPVHAREVHVRCPGGDAAVDLLGGEMRVGGPQHVPHELPLRRHPVALVTQAPRHVHGGIMPQDGPAGTQAR